MIGFSLCRFDDGDLHVHEPDPAGAGPRYDLHSMPVALLCATPGGHPVGRDVFGDVDGVLAAAGEETKGVCRFCARVYLERRAALEAETRSALGSRAWVAKPRARTAADVVIDLRLALRVSQAQLAGRLGTTQTVVSWWETGKHRPSRVSWTAMRGLAAVGGDRCVKVLREIEAIKEARDAGS